MAAAAACKRVGQLGTNSGFGLSGFGGPAASKVAVSPSLEYRHLDCRLISQLVKSNGKRLFLVDTLALVSNHIALLHSIFQIHLSIRCYLNF